MQDDEKSSRAAKRLGRRDFLRWLATLGIVVPSRQSTSVPIGMRDHEQSAALTLFLCGDVMTGRGIDQVLPHPGSPRLHEPYLNSALSYVDLAERANGPIPRHADFSYVWGDGLDALARAAPDARIVNLETAVTVSDAPWPEKGIHYRMHPRNLPCLAAARVDCCVLANNHVLDWGYAGLSETLKTLRDGGIRFAGAGADSTQAQSPAVLDLGAKGRVLVFGVGTASSGIPTEWAAMPTRPGVDLLPDLSEQTLTQLAARIAAVRRPGDVVVVSIHWGSNWGYAIPDEHRRFAHGLIEYAAVDVVHGHSSHHPRALEVFRDRLILYGCGDLINDYEGIEGYASYRADLALMYFAQLESGSGRLMRLAMAPMQMRRLRLNRPAAADVQWLAATMDREAIPYGGRVHAGADGWIELGWEGQRTG
jgi:poly-gamma-glutamate synthesis protein (capsule biosynthesis protein)